MLSNLLMRSIFSLISVVSPLTLMQKKLLANPLPNANMLIRLPWSSAGSTDEINDARPPYNDAVYMFPHRLAHFIETSTVDSNSDLEKVMKFFSSALSVSEAEYSCARMVSGEGTLAYLGAVGFDMKSFQI